MRLRQIEVFHAVYVTGSVSAAARTLNVSQPTVSAVLKRTEDELGFTLFHRVAGRLTPSERGEVVFEEIEPIFASMQELRKTTSRLAHTREARLRVAFTPALSLEIGPAAIAQFASKYPDITIEAETLQSEQIAKALKSNDIDIGLVFDGATLAGITTTHIAQTEFVLVTPDDHTLGQNEAGVHLRDIAPYSLIMLSGKSSLGRLLGERLTQSAARSLDAQILVDTYYIAKQLVLNQAGIAIVDTITARTGRIDGLAILPLAPKLAVNIDMMHRAQDPMREFILAFFKICQAQISTALAKFTQ